MAQPIWNENSKHYSLDEKTDPKDRITVEVGDSQDVTTFHPQMKLSRWDNEANVSFRLVHDWLPGTKITNDEANGVITWTKKVGQNNWIARFYEDWGTPEGAYKFVELVLPAKPPTNQISFTTQSKDVDFFYQPPLTAEEIAEGSERPPEVVGSYAIYSKSSGGMNEASGKEYKVGKLGHLYRPKFIDANGTEFWGNYNTDLNETGILTITANQTDLDNAAYPLVMDPTFGYTGTGSTNYSTNSDYYRGSRFNCPESGTLDSISFYIITSTYDDGPGDCGLVVFDSGGNHSPVVFESSPWSAPTPDAWHTLIAGGEALSNQDYLILTCSEEMATRYDTSGINIGYYKSTFYPRSWDDPLTGMTNEDRQYSIYATYTASAAGTNMQLNIGDTWKTITSAQINIGDTWKAITKIQINIGDTWKSVFALLLSIIPFWRK